MVLRWGVTALLVTVGMLAYVVGCGTRSLKALFLSSSSFSCCNEAIIRESESCLGVPLRGVDADARPLKKMLI